MIIVATFLCSCSVAQPVWDGTKDGVNSVVETGESLVTTVWYEGVHSGLVGTEEIVTAGWKGTKNVIGSVVGAGEGAVNGAYDFVTDPFASDEVTE